MIRFICLNAFIVVFTIIMCLWGLFLSLFNRSGRIIHFYTAVPWAKTILWISGVKVRIQGLENVETNAPRIYLSNHQSAFDILGLIACFPVDFKFIVKKELMRIPLFGDVLKRVGYISIDRSNPRRAMESMNEAAEKIKTGVSVLVFPEGTRSLDGSLLPLKKGGFHLALKSKCDVVPVAIINSSSIVPKGSLRIKKGAFSINIGKTVSIKDYPKKETGQLMEKVRKAILDQMKD